MTRLNGSTKALILELHINDSRDMVQLIERIAGVLDINVGEQDGSEYVRLIHLRHINVNKEPYNAH